MSELKVASCFEFEKVLSGKSNKLFYSKADADKVIAELEEKLKNSRNARKFWKKEYLLEYKECCHNKYKRCLAMSKWCKRKRFDAADYRIPRKKWEFYDKWYKRWLKIAEQIKEAK